MDKTNLILLKQKKEKVLLKYKFSLKSISAIFLTLFLEFIDSGTKIETAEPPVFSSRVRRETTSTRLQTYY